MNYECTVPGTELYGGRRPGEWRYLEKAKLQEGGRWKVFAGPPMPDHPPKIRRYKFGAND